MIRDNLHLCVSGPILNSNCAFSEIARHCDC